MRFVILSDIQGNFNALKECLNCIEKSNIDAIILCGDYVTDFPGSHDVIKIIQLYAQKYKCYIIKGNRDQNIIDYAYGKKFNLKQIKNLDYTYKSLTDEDIKWLETLPETIEIELANNKRIYVSHKCTYEKNNNYDYKIFGHSHKQCEFVRDSVKYINPGSVGIPTDGNIGAQFVVLEITNNYEKIEQYLVNYDITELIQELKSTSIYNDEIKWGKLLEKELKTGEDIPLKCIDEYEKIREEHHLTEESLEAWNIAVKMVLN